jgi:hypothetical protein
MSDQIKSDELKIKIPKWALNVLQDEVSSEIAVTGGYGSSKTFNGWIILLLKMLKYPKCKTGVFTEPVHHLIQSVAIKTFEEVVTLYFNWQEGIDYKINRSSPAVITIKRTGQQILLLSTENPARLVGFKAGFILMDEAGSCKKEARERLIARLRDANVKKCQLILPSTPEGINYYAEIYDSDTLPGWENLTDTDHIHKKETTNGLYQKRRIRIKTADNRHLPPNYVEQIQETYGHNPNYIKSYLYGIFAPFGEGLAVANYNPKIHELIDKKEFNPNDTLYLTWDWNANPMSWICLSCNLNYDKRKEYIIYDESELGYSQIPDACLEFKVKFPVEIYGKTDIFIDGDPAGFNESHKTKINDFKAVEKALLDLGYSNVYIQATSSKMREVDTLDALNKCFYENRIFLNPNLKQLKRSLMMTKLKANERKIDKPAKEDWTHKIDALKYLLFRLENDRIGNFKNRLKGFNI